MLLHVGMFKGDIVDKVTLNRELVISGREHSKRRSPEEDVCGEYF